MKKVQRKASSNQITKAKNSLKYIKEGKCRKVLPYKLKVTTNYSILSKSFLKMRNEILESLKEVFKIRDLFLKIQGGEFKSIVSEK